MRGPESKFYKKFKKVTPNIIWNRVENLAIPGMPDALGYTEALGPGTVKLYEGSVVRDLVACGLKLEPLRLGLEACGLFLSELGA